MGLSSDLPQGMVIRSATFSDLAAVLQLRQAQERVESGIPSTSAEQLATAWEALGPQLSARVWVAVTPDDLLVACAELVREDQIFHPILWALPFSRSTGVELALLAQVEQHACAIARTEGAHGLTLFSQAPSSYPAAQQALLDAGFALSSTYEKMEWTLGELSANPDAISGVDVHPFVIGQDAEAVYRADEEAFLDQRGHTPRTFAQWRQRLNFGGETFNPALWRIAWAADTVAGAALGEVVEQVGWIHHLFVRRPWRRRGLGAALTYSALRAFFQQGVGVVRLNVDAQSLTNAQYLYRRMGFKVVGDYSNYEKVVPLT
jgi:mycothiol synthase